MGANSPAGEPVADASYKAEIVLPDGARRPVAAGAAGRADGRLVPRHADRRRLRDRSHGHAEGPAVGHARGRRFLVFQQDLELDNAAADAATLESLAAMTGGQSLAPEQLPELIKRLTEDTQNLDVQQETKKTFWDTWPFFVTLVSLLGLEWYLRKRWGLV